MFEIIFGIGAGVVLGILVSPVYLRIYIREKRKQNFVDHDFRIGD